MKKWKSDFVRIVSDPVKMTQNKELSELNDEQYLAARSRQARSGDILIAKSWLITSCLMFPNNFQVSFYDFNQQFDN